MRGKYLQNGENGLNARFFGGFGCAEDYLLVGDARERVVVYGDAWLFFIVGLGARG